MTLVDLNQRGFGDANARFRVYLAAPPAMDVYQHLVGIQPLHSGDIDQIYRHCGNGWRKIFNVYAKLLFALPSAHFRFVATAHSWQQYRDHQLLQRGSDTALCFSAPQFGSDESVFHLIAGRTLAKQLMAQGLQAELHWLSSEFGVDPARNLLVTPFFDYRQLNNEKIATSASLLGMLTKSDAAGHLHAMAATVQTLSIMQSADITR